MGAPSSLKRSRNWQRLVLNVFWSGTSSCGVLVLIRLNRASALFYLGPILDRFFIFSARHRVPLRRLILHRVEDQHRPQNDMQYNSCESGRTVMCRCWCALWHSKQQIPRRTAWSSKMYLCFSYFHLHF